MNNQKTRAVRSHQAARPCPINAAGHLQHKAVATAEPLYVMPAQPAQFPAQSAIREPAQQCHFESKDGAELAGAIADALSSGQAASIATVMKGLKGQRLGPRMVSEIVAARVADGTPSLFFALKNGHAEAVAAFMDGLNGLDLSLQQIIEIVSAMGPEDGNIMSIAQSGLDADAVTAYNDGLTRLHQQHFGMGEPVAHLTGPAE